MLFVNSKFPTPNRILGNEKIPHLCCLLGATSRQVSNYKWQMVYLSNTLIEEDTHIKKRLYREALISS